MSASVLPDTNTYSVIVAAIAYDIVQTAFPINKDQSDEGIKKYLVKVTNAQVKIYSAIHSGTPLNVDDIKLN